MQNTGAHGSVEGHWRVNAEGFGVGVGLSFPTPGEVSQKLSSQTDEDSRVSFMQTTVPLAVEEFWPHPAGQLGAEPFAQRYHASDGVGGAGGTGVGGGGVGGGAGPGAGQRHADLPHWGQGTPPGHCSGGDALAATEAATQ